MSPARRAMGCCLPGLIDENACRLPDFPPGLHRQPPLARRALTCFLARERAAPLAHNQDHPPGPERSPLYPGLSAQHLHFKRSRVHLRGIFGARRRASHAAERAIGRRKPAGATARIAAPAARARNEIIMLRSEDETPAKAYVLTPQQLLRSPLEDHSEGRPDAVEDKASAFQIPLERSRFFAYTTISRALGLKRAYI